jgi:hypothetical protein
LDFVFSQSFGKLAARRPGQAKLPELHGRSVEIWLRKREGVLDQLNTGLRIPCNDYLDDVESEKDIRVIQHSQPNQRAA